MDYQKPPKMADITSCADLLNLVEYSTQLEGMAVLAAYERRQKDHALGDDPDYVALDDEGRMQADLTSYFRNYDNLKSRGSQLADADAWAVIERMSSGHVASVGSLYGTTNRGIERARCSHCFGKTRPGEVHSNVRVASLASNCALMPVSAERACSQLADRIVVDDKSPLHSLTRIRLTGCSRLREQGCN